MGLEAAPIWGGPADAFPGPCTLRPPFGSQTKASFPSITRANGASNNPFPGEERLRLVSRVNLRRNVFPNSDRGFRRPGKELARAALLPGRHGNLGGRCVVEVREALVRDEPVAGSLRRRIWR